MNWWGHKTELITEKDYLKAIVRLLSVIMFILMMMALFGWGWFK